MHRGIYADEYYETFPAFGYLWVTVDLHKPHHSRLPLLPVCWFMSAHIILSRDAQDDFGQGSFGGAHESGQGMPAPRAPAQSNQRGTGQWAMMLFWVAARKYSL